MASIEHNVQSACVRWFRLAYPDLAPLFFSVPNAGRRTRWEVQQMKAEGLWAGVADTLLLVARHGYHGLCIEFKQEQEMWSKGKRTLTRTYQRKEQREWQEAVEKQGYKYAVVRTFDESEKLIREYLTDKNG